MLSRGGYSMLARLTALVFLLIGTTYARETRAARQPGTIPSSGAVLAGIITWTLHGSTSQTTSSGGETHTHSYKVDAATTFVFVAGAIVTQRSTITLMNEDRWSCSSACSENGDIRETLKGSYSGPVRDRAGNGLVDDAPGEQNTDGSLEVRPQLTEGIIPSTGTYMDSTRPSDNGTFQLQVDYPDRDSWYPGGFPTYAPLLTVKDGPRLSGRANEHLADTIIVGVAVVLEGQETVTWNLVVVYWNGKQIAPVPPTPQPSNPAPPVVSPTAETSGTSACTTQSGPGKAVPAPPPQSNPGWGAAAPALEGVKKKPSAVAKRSIRWQTTPQLHWADFKKVPPAKPRWDAETSSGLGGGYQHGGYKSCIDAATKVLKATVQYSIANKDALFFPTDSYVLAKYAQDPTSTASTDLLNHEQRHFDISEVYSRKLHDQFLALLGGSTSRTFTCVQWTACVQQVNALDAQLEQALKEAQAQLAKAQADYDTDTDHSRNAAQQQRWNTKIDGWLASPGTVP